MVALGPTPPPSRIRTMTAEPAPSDAPAGPPPTRRLTRLLPIVVIVGGLVAAWAAGLHEALSPGRVVAARAALAAFVEARPVVAVLAYAAVYVATVALSLPGALPLTLIGGFLFGTVLGTAVTVAAATSGAMLLFLAARTAFADDLRRRAGPWLASLRRGFEENAASYLLFLRLVPVFPFWLVNLAPALLGVRPGVFALTTFVGILPGTLAFTQVGAGLDSVVAAQTAANPQCAQGGDCRLSLAPADLVTPQLLAAFALLGVVALVPVVWKAIARRRGAAPKDLP